MLPKALKELVESLKMLPGVGSRSAERYALALLKSSPESAQNLAKHIAHLHSGVDFCAKTFVFTEPGQSISPHYLDSERNRQLVVVVEDPLDAIAIENTGEFSGTYHVLGGLLSPLDGITPDQLHIKELVERTAEDQVQEVILATNASVEGESTASFIAQQLQGSNITLTRLARGIPVGVDIEYTDQLTLGRALEHRQQLS